MYLTEGLVPRGECNLMNRKHDTVRLNGGGLLLPVIVALVFCFSPISYAAEKVIQGAPDKFNMLPAGSIKARGWTAKMLKEDSGGWVKTVMDISADPENKATEAFPPDKYYEPLIRDDKHTNSMRTAGGGLQGYWLYSVFNYGWVGGIEEYKRIGRESMEDILAAYAKQGHIGLLDTSSAEGFDPEDYYVEWGLGEVLLACLYYYELTGDERVLDACAATADRHMAVSTNLNARNKSYGGALYQFFARLYMHTNNEAYLKWAESREWLPGDHVVSNLWAKLEKAHFENLHVAGVAISLAGMLDIYRASGDAKWLDAIHNQDEIARRQFVDPTGAPLATAERFRTRVDASQASHELCASSLWMLFWTRMTGVTGKAFYGDYAEKVFFNQMQAARDKDGKSHCYFSSPNWSSSVATSLPHYRYSYNTAWECCSGNYARAFLNWLGRAALVSNDGREIAVQAYAPYSFSVSLKNVGAVEATLDTDYPFEETIRITLDKVEKAGVFTFLLRNPGWCETPALAINGKSAEVQTDANGFIRVERKWRAGDTIDLTLPMRLKVDTEASLRGLAAVEYGPLLLSRPIESRRDELPPNIYEALPEGFLPEFAGGWLDTPVKEESNRNMRYILDENDPSSSLTKVDKHDIDENKHVWESAPFEFEVKAKRKGEEEPVVMKLVPIGFTRLRETYLPTDTSPPPLPTGPNLALNKKVVKWSSQFDDGPWKAGNITDGVMDDNSRGWASTAGSVSGRNEWVIVDLGKSHRISCLVVQGEFVYPGGNLDYRNMYEFTLLGSDTGAFAGEEFVLTEAKLPALKMEEKWPIYFEAKETRFVKIQAKSSYSQFVILGELGLH